jgi:hypothetical protein
MFCLQPIGHIIQHIGETFVELLLEKATLALGSIRHLYDM